MFYYQEFTSLWTALSSEGSLWLGRSEEGPSPWTHCSHSFMLGVAGGRAVPQPWVWRKIAQLFKISSSFPPTLPWLARVCFRHMDKSVTPAHSLFLFPFSGGCSNGDRTGYGTEGRPWRGCGSRGRTTGGPGKGLLFTPPFPG